MIIFKGKILLASKDNYQNLNEKSVWNFISADVLKKIGIDGQKPIPYDLNLYYLKLNEENVFNIMRENGNRLEFYSLSELENILFEDYSLEIYKKYKEAINQITKEN